MYNRNQTTVKMGGFSNWEFSREPQSPGCYRNSGLHTYESGDVNANGRHGRKIHDASGIYPVPQGDISHGFLIYKALTIGRKWQGHRIYVSLSSLDTIKCHYTLWERWRHHCRHVRECLHCPRLETLRRERGCLETRDTTIDA